MGDTDAIVVEGLTKTFRRQVAVDHVSFRVARGRHGCWCFSQRANWLHRSASHSRTLAAT